MKLQPACLFMVTCFAFGTALAMQNDESSAPRTTIEEFTRLLNAKAVIVVDVRSQESYLQGHIPGAISIPLESVAARAEELKKAGKPIVAYCS